MNSRMLVIGLAVTAMMGIRANADENAVSSETAAPQNCAACAAAPVCAASQCDLFGGLKNLAAANVCAPCGAPACATCAAAPEPVTAPCTACATPVCAVPARVYTICLPGPGTVVRGSVTGVRTMVSGLFGALAEAVNPCVPCTCAKPSCAACAAEASPAPVNAEASIPACTSAPVPADLPESPEVKE